VSRVHWLKVAPQGQFDACTGLATVMSQLPAELLVYKTEVVLDARTVEQMQDGTTIPAMEIAWHSTMLDAAEMEIISMNMKIAVLFVQKVVKSLFLIFHCIKRFSAEDLCSRIVRISYLQREWESLVAATVNAAIFHVRFKQIIKW
jgi:hypothetical protein